MRVLHCLHNYHPARGGAEWLMKNVSERLAGRNHRVRVIASNAFSVEDYVLPGGGKRLMPAGEENINGVEVERVPFSRRGLRVLNMLRGVSNRIGLPLGGRLRMISWGPRSRSYYRAALRAEADLIAACPLPTMNVWYARRAARKRNIPLVIVPCFHVEDRWTFHNELYFRWLREADAVITLTDWERQHLHRVAGVAREKLHTIGVGIDIEDISSADAGVLPAGPAGGEKETVIFLGQHGLHKGILHLIKAMQTVWRVRERTSLIIAGNPTAHTAEIERKIRELRPEERARVELIKGFPEEQKRNLLRRADVFVSVSFMESFGIVFLEAWRERLPVIGCRRGGSSKVIDEFRDGLLVEFGKPRQLAGALLELLEDRDIRRKMGEAGYRRARDTYSWDKIIPLWEKIYEDVIRRKRNSLPSS